MKKVFLSLIFISFLACEDIENIQSSSIYNIEFMISGTCSHIQINNFDYTELNQKAYHKKFQITSQDESPVCINETISKETNDNSTVIVILFINNKAIDQKVSSDPYEIINFEQCIE